MKRDVLIVDKLTGKQVGVYPVARLPLDHAHADTDYFDEAWKCATIEGDADPERKGDFAFSFVQ